MFEFRWATIEQCSVVPEILAAWEIAAIFKGRCKVTELNIDVDAARETYIAEAVDEDLRDDYRSEPQMAEDEMLENFSAEMKAAAKERSASLGDHYPFTFSPSNDLEAKPASALTGPGVAYLALQFYRAVVAQHIEIEAPDDETRKRLLGVFNRWFPKVFEIIASYAVSGDQGGIPHITAHCRSSQRLFKMLQLLCRNLSSGQTKRYEDWTAVQRSSNDGGVDCIVQRGRPGMIGPSYLVLVGATIQDSQIKNKIVGQDQRSFFGDFFSARPAALQGALVRPADPDQLTIERCRGSDCLLYAYDDLWKNMGNRPMPGREIRFFRNLDAKARRLVRQLAGIIFIDNYDRYGLSI